MIKTQMKNKNQLIVYFVNVYVLRALSMMEKCRLVFCQGYNNANTTLTEFCAKIWHANAISSRPFIKA